MLLSVRNSLVGLLFKANHPQIFVISQIDISVVQGSRFAPLRK